MPLTAGQVLNNRYRIVTLLGQGGFGAVYRAWDLNMERPRALKENLETAPQAQRQFLREAQLLGDLSHPNLPRVIDHFIVAGQGQYLVMDYVEGEDLAHKLQQAGGPLGEAQALEWIEQVCGALAYLHAQNPPVIHRDIKPANIRITPAGKAMLVDFGIAKLFDPQIQTTMGARAVTPGYSPPEQYGRGRRTDTRSDIYALGATLYALLTGQEPVEAPERNLGVALPAPSSLNPALSPPVEAAILKAMALLPDERFQAAQSLQAALRPTPAPAALGRASGGAQIVPDTQPPVSPATPTGAAAARLPWGWIGAGAALLLVVALLLGGWLGSQLSAPADPTPTPSFTASASPASSLAPTDTPPPAPPASHTPAPPTASATFASLPPQLTDERGVPMALIPAGEFRMGEDADISLAECQKYYNCERDWFTDEEPVHTVSLDAYYIDVYEVTNARYAACVQERACDPPSETSSFTQDNYYGDPAYADYPVLYVDWNAAQVYCQWRGGSLPSEAQWEKAARGGLEGMIYPWGNRAATCQLANFFVVDNKMCQGDIYEVGSYAANGFGLYDVVGNVREWVYDWYQDNYYGSSPFANPTGADSGGHRVARGGVWFNSEDDLHVANRLILDPSYSNYDLGFRCARLPQDR
jgi:serine/threonine protein kinase